MMNITPTVKQLLILNIIFYIGSQIVGDGAYAILAEYYPENSNFQIWQPLTAMFMHAPLPNFTHILFNMFALYSFGSALEQFWGGKKFLFFYISCGLGAALLHNAVNYYTVHEGLKTLVASGIPETDVMQLLKEGKFNPGWEQIMSSSQYNNFLGAYFGTSLGASGAVYGLLVAFAFMFPNAGLMLLFIPFPIKAKYFVPGLLLIDLFLGLKGDSIFGSGGTGIAHFAHIGGAIIGFLMMWYWKKNQFNSNRWN